MKYKTAPKQQFAPGLLTKRDAAQALTWSIRSLELAMRAKRIAFIRMGRSVRFRRADIDSFIERHRLRSVAD